MALIKIIEGAIEGTDTWADVWSKAESLVDPTVKKIESALETFTDQFLSDFGSQALSQAAALAPAVIAGTTSIQDAAATLGGQITADALTDAEKDGTVALNALRVNITAQTAAPTVITPTAEPEQSADPAPESAS
jgi:hypothetical protein